MEMRRRFGWPGSREVPLGGGVVLQSVARKLVMGQIRSGRTRRPTMMVVFGSRLSSASRQRAAAPSARTVMVPTSRRSVATKNRRLVKVKVKPT
jgi:hypothetical protein